MQKSQPNHGVPLRIVQLTDTHLYADPERTLYGINTDQTLRHVISRVREDAPSAALALLTGDLVHDGSAEGYDRVSAHVSELGLPTYSLAGNHDGPDTMARVFRGTPVHYQRTVTVGGWLLIFLNSHLPGSDAGGLGKEQIQTLNTLLEGARQRHVLICVHHQPVPIGSPWIDSIGLRDADDLWRVLERHSQVRGVLWGHVHQEYHGQRQGVQLYGSPSTCIQFKPRCEDFALDEAPPAYRWMELWEDGTIHSGIVPVPISSADA